MRFLIVIVALPVLAAAGPNAFFDGARPGPGARPPMLSGEAPDLGSVGPLDTEVPPDLAAAKAVWGSDAMKKRLAAAPPSASGVSFGVIGDAEPGRFFWERWFNPGADVFARQLDELQARGPELIMQLGDFVSKGIAKNYREHLELLARHAHLPLFHIQGNHDRSAPNGPADKNLYRAVFGAGDYFFERGGWRFVAFDSADYAVTDAQLDWLDAALDTEVPAIIFMHIPPDYLKGKVFSKGPGDKDIQAAFLAGWFDGGAARFREIVERRRVKRVYMGHIHSFAQGEVGGVKYVITAGGGSPFYPLPPGYPTRRKGHYLWVQAQSNGSLTETVHELDGTTFPIRW